MTDKMAARSTKSLLGLTASYVFDWVLVIITAIGSYFINNLSPNKHPFSLVAPSISYPYKGDTVTLPVLVIVAAVVPIVVIIIATLVLVPGSNIPRGIPRARIWKLKLWEVHASLLGLAVSLIGTFFVSNAVKNMMGKPRPNLLSRCDPDVSAIALHLVGGFVTTTDDGRLVSAGICATKDAALLDEGFRSFPSGHSSFSSAGLVYLTLFLASRLGAWVPAMAAGNLGLSNLAVSAFPSHLGNSSSMRSTVTPTTTRRQDGEDQSFGDGRGPGAVPPKERTIAAARRQAAAPPLYLLIIMISPLLTSVYICVSRWYDYQHHGFDVIAGFLLGATAAYVAFRMYHLPISTGAGWAWGPRSSEKSLWAGVGSDSYATGWLRDDRPDRDVV